MAQMGTCGQCGATYKVGKSTAAKYLLFCSKACEWESLRGAKQPPLPTPTRETPTATGVGTTEGGGFGYTWPILEAFAGTGAGAGAGKGKAHAHTPTHSLLKTCVHDGSLPVFTLSSGKHLYGARASSLMTPGRNLSHLGVILDASGIVKFGATGGFIRHGGGRKFRALNALCWPDVVTLNWPDMSAPTYVRLPFWLQLLQAIPDHTCVSCIGSHGRTGTALAALLVADGMGGEEAIAAVRGKHCSHAIETAGQADYIRGLAKQMTTAGVVKGV